MPETFDSQPLRAQKRARTRLALVEALLERLADRSLEEVAVRELAVSAGISEATFFNYFPTKADLLVHFIQLWSLRVGAMARVARREHDSALAAVEAVLVTTAEMTAASPNVMSEVIAAQARMDAMGPPEPIELAERLLFLSDETEVEDLPDDGLGGVLPVLLADAVANGELPAGTDVGTLTLAVVSVFFGVPLILGRRAPDAVAPMYRQQLALLWRGARAPEEEA